MGGWPMCRLQQRTGITAAAQCHAIPPMPIHCPQKQTTIFQCRLMCRLHAQCCLVCMPAHGEKGREGTQKWGNWESPFYQTYHVHPSIHSGPPEKLLMDASHQISERARRSMQVKLALSRRLCGLLIGHKGQTVRDFINDSGSTIRVQSLSELTPSDPERTITVSGARDQVLRAIALILNTVRMLERGGI
eukprot:349777-Chlamydomonas_euryale.AAC.2